MRARSCASFVESAKPTVDCWLNGSNKTSTRACHGFESGEWQAVVIARRDAINNDQGYVSMAQGSFSLFFMLLHGFREGHGRQGQPDFYTSSRCARVLVLLDPLSQQPAVGLADPTNSQKPGDGRAALGRRHCQPVSHEGGCTARGLTVTEERVG